MSHAPVRNTASSFKPLLPSPRSLLSIKPLTSTASSSPSPPRRSVSASASSRRDFLLLIPSLAAASAVLRAAPAAAADDQASPPPPAESPAPAPPPPPQEKEPEGDETAVSRVYDATVIGEPQAVGREAKGRVWDKLAAARVVYLGEAELVPDPDDRVLELEIVTKLAGRCADAERRLALALEAFPCDLQQQLDEFMSGRCAAAPYHFNQVIRRIASDKNMVHLFAIACREIAGILVLSA